MFKRILLVFVCSLLLMSCKVSFSKQDYQPLTSFEELNGTYVNEGDSLARMFNLGWKDINLINLEFKDNRLNISYLTEIDTIKRSYKGQVKNNYFEFYLEKRRIIALILNSIWTEKVRIGKNIENQMIVQNGSIGFGNFLIIVGGNASQSTYTYPSNLQFLVYPFEENGKWGYKKSLDSIIIEAKYDYVRLYEGDVARVKLNGKWGLIDVRGEPLTECKYDLIESFEGSVARLKFKDKWGLVNKQGELLTDFKYDKIERLNDNLNVRKAFVNNKVGYLDNCGYELIPCIYDKIQTDYGGSPDYGGNFLDTKIFRIQLDKKHGFASFEDGVIYPPVFDSIASTFTKVVTKVSDRTEYATVKMGKHCYLVDKDGYAYRFTNRLTIRSSNKVTILYDTKIKVTDLVRKDEE